MKLCATLCYLWAFLIIGLAHGQVPTTIQLSEKDGLPDIECYTIIEDQDQFIWVASNSGLSRYNGDSFINFKAKGQVGQALFNPFQDKNGTLWCNNLYGQVLRKKPQQDLTIFVDLSAHLKGHLAELSWADHLLVVSWEKGVLLIDENTAKIVKSFTTGMVYARKLGDHLYFVSTTGDVYKLTRQTLQKVYSPTQAQHITRPLLFKLGQQLVFGFKTGPTYQFYDIAATTPKKLTVFKEIQQRQILQIKQNNTQLWLATDQGVYVYSSEVKPQLLAHYFNDFYVTDILVDHRQQHWFTTLRNGIHLMPNLGVYQKDISDIPGTVASLCSLPGKLALGTTKGGVYLLEEPSLKMVSSISLPNKQAISKLFYNKFTNSIIISTHGEGSYVYQLDTKQLTNTHKRFDVAKDMAFLSKSDMVYLTYNHAQVYAGDTSIHQLKQQRPFATVHDFDTQSTYIAYLDELLRYDAQWNPHPILTAGKPVLFTCMQQTKDGKLWGIGEDFGLLGLANDTVFTKIVPKDGLFAQKVKSMVSHANWLWLSSTQGLQRIHTPTKSIYSITSSNGLGTSLSNLALGQHHVYLASKDQLYRIEQQIGLKQDRPLRPAMQIDQVQINHKDTLVAQNYNLAYHQNAISFHFLTNTFRSREQVRYVYQLEGLDTLWLSTRTPAVTYESLPAGQYRFKVKSKTEAGQSKIQEIAFTIKRPYWRQWWFIGLFVAAGLCLLWLIYRHQMRLKEAEQERILATLIKDHKMTNLRLENLRSQMNPHFMFNALNSIQLFMVENESKLARSYLVKFARLIRIYLEHGQKNEVSLAEELEGLYLYLALEKLRFSDGFEYHVAVDKDLDIHNIFLPSIFIQPYVENAIKHGLRKENDRDLLSISFTKDKEKQMMICTITDNGPGINAVLQEKRKSDHKSFATNANKERLALYNLKRIKKITLSITDLTASGGSGTRITIGIPI